MICVRVIQVGYGSERHERERHFHFTFLRRFRVQCSMEHILPVPESIPKGAHLKFRTAFMSSWAKRFELHLGST